MSDSHTPQKSVFDDFSIFLETSAFYPLNICLPFKGRDLLSIYCRTAINCENDKLKYLLVIDKEP